MHLDLDAVTRFIPVVDKKRSERFNRTCFRDQKPLAGNFALWSSFLEMMEDERLCALLIGEINQMRIKCSVSGSWRLTLDYGRNVGWPAVILVHDLPGCTAVKTIMYRKGANAKGVNDPRFVAPASPLITFVFDVRQTPRKHIVARVKTLYPGNVHVSRVLSRQAVILNWECQGSPLRKAHQNFEEVTV